MTALFAKGLAFGFVLAATVGPMWVLCFRRTVASGARAGLVTGLGIALGDTIYGAIAAFGLTAISGLLQAQSLWLGLAGAAFLAYLGIRTLRSTPNVSGNQGSGQGSLARAFLSTLGLTLANPPTILAFAAIFAGLGLAQNASYTAAALVTLGVFLGSASWWLILAAAAGWLHGRVGPGLMRAINVVSGVSILGFAFWQLAQLV